jgi:hypothetical protein
METLLEESYNERMHLLTFLKMAEPGWFMRLAVLATQGVFFNAFFVAYLVAPKVCHRFVGYLEEEAGKSLHSFSFSYPSKSIRKEIFLLTLDEPQSKPTPPSSTISPSATYQNGKPSKPRTLPSNIGKCPRDPDRCGIYCFISARMKANIAKSITLWETWIRGKIRIRM